MTPADAAGARTVPLLAIVLMILGVSIGAVNGAMMKAVAAELPEVVAGWGRYAVYLGIMLIIVLWRREHGVLRPAMPGLQVLRGALQCFATWSFIVAVGGMPVADAIAVIYVYPFVLTALAPFVLAERVPLVAWIGVVGGFAGVMLVVRPDFGHVDSHAVWAMLCGVAIAGQLMINRRLAGTSSAIATSTVSACVGTVILGVLLPFHWQWPSGYALALVVALGATSALNQWMVLVAFAKAPASVLAPFGYAEIPAGALVGFLWFGDLPDTLVWLGITVIILSGVIVARASYLPARTAPRAEPG